MPNDTRDEILYFSAKTQKKFNWCPVISIFATAKIEQWSSRNRRAVDKKGLRKRIIHCGLLLTCSTAPSSIPVWLSCSKIFRPIKKPWISPTG
jgi:hypothetical protein